MVVVLIGGLFLISEYPNDDNNIKGGMLLVFVICIIVLFTQGQAPKGAARPKRTGPAVRSRPPMDDLEKPPQSTGPTITPAMDNPSITPAPLPLDVPMATLAPVTPVTPLVAPTLEPLTSPSRPPVLPTLARSEGAQVRSPVHSRRKIPYPFHVGGGDFANTHILINKDTILQLRTALTADFQPAPVPDYVSVSVSIPKIPFQPPEEPEVPASIPGAAATVSAIEGGPSVAVATMPEVASAVPMAAGAPVAAVAVAAQPTTAAAPVAAMAVAATPGVAVATPVAVGAAPVAIAAVPGAPAVATAAVAVKPGEVAPAATDPSMEPAADDDMTIDFGDDDEEDLEWG